MSEQEQTIQAGFVRGMIEAVQEIAGVQGRNLVLHQAHLEQYIENPPPMDDKVFVPIPHYQALERAMMDVFGSKGSRVVLLYAGEATIHRAIEGIPGLFSSVMKLIPGGLRKQAVFQLAVSQTTRSTGVPAKVEFHKDWVVFSNPGCTACAGRHSDEPICYYASGMLITLAEWATGKKYKAPEVKCKAKGDEACVYEVREA